MSECNIYHLDSPPLKCPAAKCSYPECLTPAAPVGDDVRDLAAELRDLSALDVATRLKSQAARIAELERERDDEKAIVTRIWEMLGNPTYKELAGRSIYDLIAEIQAQLTAAQARWDQHHVPAWNEQAARIAELERERDNLLLGHVWRDKSIGPAFDDLQRQLAAAQAAIADLFALMDEGYLVRDTSRDAEPGFAMRQLPYVARLAKARRALDASPSAGSGK